jgi:hypothetical protein
MIAVKSRKTIQMILTSRVINMGCEGYQPAGAA